MKKKNIKQTKTILKENPKPNKLQFVWKLKKNNFKWTDKKNGKGVMTFANEELLWYIGTDEEIEKYYPETETHKFKFCVIDFVILFLKNRNLDNEAWINQGKQFIQEALNQAIKENISLVEFNEWFMYKKGISQDLVCPNCNVRIKPDRYGDFPSSCTGKMGVGQSYYLVDCDAKLFRTWKEDGTFKDIFYEVDLKEREAEEKYQRKQEEERKAKSEENRKKLQETVKLTEEEVRKQSEIHYKALNGELLTKEEFELADEMTKFLALEHYKAQQSTKIRLQLSEIEIKKKREQRGISEAHKPVTGPKKEIKENDEMYKVCKLYIKAVVDMYQLSTVQGAEKRRSKYHTKLSELSGLSEIHIAGASTMLDSTIGFPSVELTGGATAERRKVIVIDYGHKLYRWILREQRRLKKKG